MNALVHNAKPPYRADVGECPLSAPTHIVTARKYNVSKTPLNMAENGISGVSMLATDNFQIHPANG